MWHYHQIDQADLDAAAVALTANMQMRFTVNDDEPQSIVEAGLDEFHVIASPGRSPYDAGDLNCDCSMDAFDIEPFVVALVEPDEYAGRYPGCDINLADINGDGAIDAFDIEPFLELLFP